MIHSHLYRNSAFLCLLFLTALAIGHASAQARKTATRGNELDAFATFTGVDNNYSPPLANYGVTVGGDYTHFITQFRGLITPSFQVRATFTPGGSVGLHSVEGGLKLASTFHGFHPYGDFMLGNGVITFTPPPVPDPNNKYRDTSFLYVYGGGVTYDLKIPNFSLMADYQHQYYDLGTRGSSAPIRFYPKAYSLGVVYHIPFKAYKTR